MGGKSILRFENFGNRKSKIHGRKIQHKVSHRAAFDARRCLCLAVSPSIAVPARRSLWQASPTIPTMIPWWPILWRSLAVPILRKHCNFLHKQVGNLNTRFATTGFLFPPRLTLSGTIQPNQTPQRLDLCIPLAVSVPHPRPTTAVAKQVHVIVPVVTSIFPITL